MPDPKEVFAEFRPRGPVEVEIEPDGKIELWWPLTGLSVLLPPEQARSLTCAILDKQLAEKAPA